MNPLTYFLAFLLSVQTLPAAPHTIQEIQNEKNVDQLLLLMQKRLVIMHEVARTKWNQNIPIEDLEREQQILSGLAHQASKQGLDEKWALKFFQAQMNAAKEIQKEDFLDWKKQGVSKFERVFNLKDDLRQSIDQINQEMIQLLGTIPKENISILDHPLSNRPSDRIESHIWQMATSPLRAN